MVRRAPVAAAAALAALATLGACSSDDSSTGTAGVPTQSESATAPSADEPIDITRIPEDTVLEPGRYSMPFYNGDDTMRAIVEVPDGYTNYFSVIGSGDGDLAFWGSVTQVDTDPCHGGKHVRAGTSVHDLASLLVVQRHMKTSQPVPVTIGGYHGVYLKATAPADINRCRGGVATIYSDADSRSRWPSTWWRQDVPNGIFQMWILNVHGQRVVGHARVIPDRAHGAELSHIVETAEFTVAD
jgi:hypothetical protein